MMNSMFKSKYSKPPRAEDPMNGPILGKASRIALVADILAR